MDIRIRVNNMVPRGKGSPRAVRRGKFTQITPDEKTAKWEASFAAEVAHQMPLGTIDFPVRVDILAIFPRTKELSKIFKRTGQPKYPPGFLPHTIKPDRDNITKSVQDSLKVHWRDDRLVTWGETIKAYCELDGKPRIVLRIRSVGRSLEDNSAISLPIFQASCQAIEGTFC